MGASCEEAGPILALVVVLGLAVVVGAGAAEYAAAPVRVEVRVWQDVEEEGEIHVSARPRTARGERWAPSPCRSTTV